MASNKRQKTVSAKMAMVKLGDTGPTVSDICLGTMTWGSQMTDEKQAFEILDYYVEAGGNFIDTAEMYPVPPKEEYVGSTENIIGRWLQANPGVREKVCIATKVAGPSPRSFVVENRTEPKASNAALPNLSHDDIISACNASLRRLQTSYIDILYLHWPSRPAPIFGKSGYQKSMEDTHPWVGKPYKTVEFKESILAMKTLMDQKKIRHWAISNETSFGVCTIAAECKSLGVPKPVCIQNDFSLTDRRFENELAEACAPWNHNISGVPYGLLCGGTLSGKYLDGAKPEGGRHVWNPNFQARYQSDKTMAACAKYKDIAQKANISLPVLALAWAKQCFYNQSIIVGANNMKQLQENLSISDVTLSVETLAAVDKVHFEDKNPNVMA